MSVEEVGGSVQVGGHCAGGRGLEEGLGLGSLGGNVFRGRVGYGLGRELLLCAGVQGVDDAASIWLCCAAVRWETASRKAGPAVARWRSAEELWVRGRGMLRAETP